MKSTASLDNVTKLIIPNEWIPTDVAQTEPIYYGSIVFDEGCFDGKLNSVESIRFDASNLTFKKNSFKMGVGVPGINYLEFKSLVNDEDITIDDGAFEG
ncbi:MAG: hypothetical protein MJ201_05290 [Mycoplasmoidaceae bacterium]|nr:hypothetical protein [Mycoplasmoidaceae bacterium]